MSSSTKNLWKLGNAALELSAVPEALMTARAATDKMKGKSKGTGEPAVSFVWKREGKVAQTELSQIVVYLCGQRGHCSGDPGCSGPRETRK